MENLKLNEGERYFVDLFVKKITAVISQNPKKESIEEDFTIPAARNIFDPSKVEIELRDKLKKAYPKWEKIRVLYLKDKNKLRIIMNKTRQAFSSLSLPKIELPEKEK